MNTGNEVKNRRPFEDTLRTLEFWRRASGVYVAYKGAQARAAFLSKAKGWDADKLKDEFWKPHHTWYGSSPCPCIAQYQHFMPAVMLMSSLSALALVVQGWEGVPLNGSGSQRFLSKGTAAHCNSLYVPLFTANGMIIRICDQQVSSFCDNIQDWKYQLCND